MDFGARALKQSTYTCLGARSLGGKDLIQSAPNYPFRHPKYHLIGTIRPSVEVHWGFKEQAFPGADQVPPKTPGQTLPGFKSRGSLLGVLSEPGSKLLKRDDIYIYIYICICIYLEGPS